jgi:hypothetical protein
VFLKGESPEVGEKTQRTDKNWTGFALKALLIAFAGIILTVLSIASAHWIFGITSSNAVLYFVKAEDGKLKVTNDLRFDEASRLLFMVDASCVLRFFEEFATAVTRKPVLELTWNKEEGNGVIKEYRPDGTNFLIVLSRYSEQEGRPRGLFIGGDLPYGDVERWLDKSRNNTGIAFHDGSSWRHIWCSINEALTIKDLDNLSIGPWRWRYMGSRVLKSTNKEIILESIHELRIVRGSKPLHLMMRRFLSKRSGDDYILLKVELKNLADEPVYYNYSFGDEPWVGEFGNSIGDVGWTEGKVFRFEGYVSPLKYRYAGIWDRGNPEAGEPERFSNYANFIEWLDNTPTVVYFSNSFTDVDENRPLNSFDNRILNLLWLYQVLMPGESKTYTLALGMARPEPHTGLPMKPDVILSAEGS